ncbi:MAG: polymerase family protein [Verrucomicrobiaceae bacterium]|nr:polymerase family protein [Verrucomicrobiaceae bacterium]
MRAAIWLPRFQLQAALRDMPGSPSATLALLDEARARMKEKDCVLHASETAERHGVHAGMTATQAQARCPRLIFLHRDAASEASAQQCLLDSALQWTPDYESTAPGVCVMDMDHLRDMGGNEEACGQSLHEQLLEEKLDARVGFAMNPDLAVLAAQVADPVRVLRNDREAAAFLQNLPVTSLRPSQEILDILKLWGVSTLGGLIKLPRADVTARLGREGLLLWDMAAGGRERLLKLVRPPVSYKEEQDLEYSLESLEPLLFLLRRMLQRLCSRLSSAWMAAAAMRLTMRLADETTHTRELNVPEPTRDEELLIRVLHTHLEGLGASAPITHLALEITPARAVGNQASLFERALRDPNRFAETLARLEALLGTGRVGKARLQPSRRIDAFSLVNFAEKPAPPLLNNHTPPHGLPLRRLRPAVSVEVRLAAGRPIEFVHGHQRHVVSSTEGPWILSGDWWDVNKIWSKQVWAVQTRDGVLYQLALQNDKWIVEGMLG